jgi:hypothetical protein
MAGQGKHGMGRGITRVRDLHVISSKILYAGLEITAKLKQARRYGGLQPGRQIIEHMDCTLSE